MAVCITRWSASLQPPINCLLLPLIEAGALCSSIVVQCSQLQQWKEEGDCLEGERRVAAISDHHRQPGETMERPPGGDPEDRPEPWSHQ